MSGEILDIVIRLTPHVGYVPAVLDATGNRLFTGVPERSPAFALSQAIGFINNRDEDEKQ